MSDDVWRQMARDNPGMAIYRQFNPQTMSGTRFGDAMREVLSPAEVHELIDDLADVGLLWCPPVDITQAEAEEIKARFLAPDPNPAPIMLGPPMRITRRRWWHRWIRP